MALKPFDAAVVLTDDGARTAYAESALETGHPDHIAEALGDIARSIGMTKVAQETGLSRNALYKSLRAGGNPTLATMSKVLAIVGLGLTVTASAKLAEQEAA
ncbi:MAG: addiction module antidote protein [Pacificimonas sp.]|jgi:probable addiction module antidote protein|nr:addiction module antidote protein [Pacificimonas sp.]